MAELRSNAPHALRLPAAAFSTARRACDVASDALCRDAPRGAGLSAASSRRHRQALHPRPSRQRRPLQRHQDVFPRRVLSPLRKAPALAETLRLAPPPCRRFRDDRRRRITDNPPPYPRLCHRAPASGTRSPTEHEAGRLDPTHPACALAGRLELTWTKCLSSTSATRTAYEHNHVIDRSPARSSAQRAQLALDWEETSGWV